MGLRESGQRCSLGRQILTENWSEARLQYSVKLIIRNKAHGSAECAFISTAIVLLKCAFVVLVALIKWDSRVEIQIGTAINDCEKVLCYGIGFVHFVHASKAKIGLT